MYSMTRVRSALIAVRMRRFCRFLKRERNNTYQIMIKKFTLSSGEEVYLLFHITAIIPCGLVFIPRTCAH